MKYDKNLFSKVYEIKEKLPYEEKIIIEQMMSYTNQLTIRLKDNNIQKLRKEKAELMNAVDILTQEKEELQETVKRRKNQIDAMRQKMKYL